MSTESSSAGAGEGVGTRGRAEPGAGAAGDAGAACTIGGGKRRLIALLVEVERLVGHRDRESGGGRCNRRRRGSGKRTRLSRARANPVEEGLELRDRLACVHEFPEFSFARASPQGAPAAMASSTRLTAGSLATSTLAVRASRVSSPAETFLPSAASRAAATRGASSGPARRDSSTTTTRARPHRSTLRTPAPASGALAGELGDEGVNRGRARVRQPRRSTLADGGPQGTSEDFGFCRRRQRELVERGAGHEEHGLTLASRSYGAVG